METKYVWVGLVAFVLFICYGCPVESDDDFIPVEIELDNRTNRPVTIISFNFVNSSPSRVSLDENGVVLSGTAGIIDISPGTAFNSDSILIIYDDTRKELFTENGISNNTDSPSIFDIGNYVKAEEAERYTYTLTQTNYENAEVCDGPCEN